MRGATVVLRGELRHGLYVLQGSAIIGSSVTASKDTNQTVRWHKRLGHIGLKGLQELCRQGILDSKVISIIDLCESCVLGKSHKLKFSSTTHSTKGIIDYVHVDLWGFPKVPFSLNHSQYFISFVDEFSRRV